MSLSNEQKSFFFVLAVMAIIAVVSVRIYFSLRTDSVADNLQNDQVIKVLFVVHDEDKNVLSSDVFLYYPNTGKGALFDIVGNIGAIYKKSLGRVDRIDAVYKEKGVAVYKEEVEALTDLTIPFAIEIAAENFGHLADLMGGLRVFIPSPVDAAVPGGSRWLLPSGAVTLDGDKVQTYLSYKLEDEEDSEQESRRQGAFIAFLSLLHENRHKIADKKNFSYYQRFMTANVEDKWMYEIFRLICNIDTDTLTLQTVIGSSRVVDGKVLLFPYQNGQLIKDVIKQKIRMLVNENTDAGKRVYVVEVLNGTSKQGLARNASFLLQNAGYNIQQVGNASKTDYAHTVIINHIGDDLAAEALGDFINCYNVIGDDEDSAVAEDVDFTLILGDDWDGRYVRGGFGKNDSDVFAGQTDVSVPDAGSGDMRGQE